MVRHDGDSSSGFLQLCLLKSKRMKHSTRTKARCFKNALLKFDTILTAQIILKVFEITTVLSNRYRISAVKALLASFSQHSNELGTQFRIDP